MKVNQMYISNHNVYMNENSPKYIVIHETDNFAKGANAERHAIAQFNGELETSVHYYCGDDGVYQSAMLSDGVWAIGKEYGGSHVVRDATNRNSINIEICVNEDGNYSIARKNAVELVKQLMLSSNIPAERVVRHYDAKGKYCPRKMLDKPELWLEFKRAITVEGDLIKDETKVVAIVNTQKDPLMLRDSANGNILAKMPKGSVVEVIEAPGTGNKWCKIKYGDIVGYCFAEYLSIGNSNEIMNDEKLSYCTGDAVRLRSAPGFDTKVLNYLYKGDSVNVIEKSGCWCKVQTNYGNGWMYSGYVK